MLVLQTVLPPLLTADGPSKVVLEGGTHNPLAPPFEFIERSYLPLVERMGPKVTATLERHVFYPAGGGRASIWIEPAERLAPLVLHERGEVRQCHATGLVASLPRDIADRELSVVGNRLGWPAEALHLRHLTTGYGPGNVLSLEVCSEHVTAVFTGFGERGVSAETVAARAARCVQQYLDAQVPVCEYLADQLMLLLAMAGGGSYTTLPLTRHSQTNRDVIATFLDVRINSEEVRPGAWAVEVTGG
jgi:RNA 3'-terminal phosphate cyclase (ATP)